MKKNLLLLTLLALPFAVTAASDQEILQQKMSQQKGFSYTNNGFDFHQQAVYEEQKYERSVFIAELAAQADQEGFEKIKKREAKPFIDEHQEAEPAEIQEQAITKTPEQLAAEKTQRDAAKAQRQKEEAQRAAAKKAKREEQQALELARFEAKLNRERAAREAEMAAEATAKELQRKQQLARRAAAAAKIKIKPGSKFFDGADEFLKNVKIRNVPVLEDKVDVYVINTTDQKVVIFPTAIKEGFPTGCSQKEIPKKNMYHTQVNGEICTFGISLPSTKNITIETYEKNNPNFFALVVLITNVNGIFVETAYCIDRNGIILDPATTGITLKHEDENDLTF